MTYVPHPPAADKPRGEQPHFEIQIGDGRSLLLLRPRTFFGWLRVESLQLAIPHVTFPLDITSGMAQFQRQRCPLLEATFRVDRQCLADLAQRRSRLLAAAGFEDVGVALTPEAIELTARVRLREWTAELLARIAVEAEERVVRLRVVDAATFGYVRRPAPLVAHDLLCLLAGVSAGATTTEATAEPAVTRGLGVVQLEALDWFALGVLGPAGWRLPELEGVRVAEVALSEAGVVLRWGRAVEPEAALAPAGLRAANVDRMAAQSIDDALWRNDLAGAATACRLEITRRPEQAALLTECLMAILCTREASLREAEGVARAALSRWPDCAAAYLTLAAVRTARGETLEAAQHFAEAARVAEARGDLAVAVRAAAAAARQLSPTDAARAVALYERVLLHRPGDREATDALVELYAISGRWSDLRQLLQLSLAGARDDGERLEARLRAAELSFTRLRDPAAARVDLQAAAELAPDDRRVWDLTAQVCEAAGQREEAIFALERLAEVLAKNGERLAEARALLRVAGSYEDIGEPAAALQRYQRALELTPDDPAALERFAAVAARHGDAAGAIGAYRRLLERSDGAADRRRRCEQQLLQLLVIVGERDEARQLLATVTDEPSPDLLMGLARLEEASDDFAAAGDLWARAAAQLDGQHAAAAELEHARVCRAASLPDLEQTALSRAFALAPMGHEGLAAASGLIRLAREAGDRAAEAAWLDRILSCEPAPPHLAELALRRAQLFIDAGDGAGAARLLEALESAGHRGPAVQRMWADVRGALGDAAGRAAVLESLATECEGDDERARLLVQAAQSRLAAGDVEAADRDARAAEAIAPADLAVRATIAELAWRGRAWEQVLVACSELSADTAGEARVEWMRRLAVAHDRLGRTPEALATLTAAVAQADGCGEALGRAWRDLGQLHERVGEHGAALDCYRRGGADERVWPRAARLELWRNAAEILHRRMGRSEEAAAALTEALALDARDLPTLDALDALQSEVGDDVNLLATLVRKLELPDVAPERRRDWLQRYGELAAARGQLDVARHAFAELLAVEPRHSAALRWLAADAAACADQEAASEHYDARLVVHGDVPAEEQRAARLRLAARARGEARLADAEVHLWSAVELSPGPEQLPLLAELEEVYRQAERWADLVVVLNHHAATTADGAERLELELRRVSILTRELGTPKLAIEAAQAAIERYGAEPRLLAAWADAATAAGERAMVAEARLAQAKATVDRHERGRWLAEAAAIQVELGDRERARALVHELTTGEVDPGAGLALVGVVDDPALAIALGQAVAAAAPSGESRAAAWRAVAAQARGCGAEDAEREALAALWADGQAGADRPRLLTLLEAAGCHEEAARLARELLGETLATTPAGDPAPLLASLRATAQTSDGLRALAEALALAATATPDDDAAVALLREAAAVRGKLDDFVAAAGSLFAALTRQPADPALSAELQLLLEDLGDVTRQREALELHAAALDGAARLPLLGKLARLAEEAGDTEAAQRHLAEARRLEPQAAARVNVRALMRSVALDRPAGSNERPRRDEIAQMEARLLATDIGDVLGLRAVRRRLGELYRDAGRLTAAFEQLSALLVEEPSNTEVVRALLEVAETDGRWAEAAELIARLSQLVASPIERAALLHRAGECYLQRLDDEAAASDCYLRAIDLDAGHAPTLRRLVDYFWTEGDLESVAEMAQTLDEQQGFAAPETVVGTRARAALATAVVGDLRRAVRLGGALDEAGGATALSRAAVELLRARDEAAVAQALRAVSGAGSRLEAVRRRLAERGGSDARAAALAERLGR